MSSILQTSFTTVTTAANTGTWASATIFPAASQTCTRAGLPRHETEEAAPAGAKHTSSWDSNLENGDNNSRDDVTLTDPVERNEARLWRLSSTSAIALPPVMTDAVEHTQGTDAKRLSMPSPPSPGLLSPPAYSSTHSLALSDVSSLQRPRPPTQAHFR
ncbi:hypothetical protein FRB96_005816 [Tulasnella sp. 330]|nr:hypothetical protein FRB96_005816 [Tulasnella sp. 330]KAG8876022.1 hypothetical protein FRB97_004520 [Tulasnella sp. 331]KAG8881530.1 hypothetical protein FRB98_004269 [Tulasnella sp. 332]